jgi:hypothetical protein
VFNRGREGEMDEGNQEYSSTHLRGLCIFEFQMINLVEIFCYEVLKCCITSSAPLCISTHSEFLKHNQGHHIRLYKRVIARNTCQFCCILL